MAVLSDEDRREVMVRAINHVYVGPNRTATLNTDDWQAATNAADVWADANAGAFNGALPLPFRTTATAQEKTMLLANVLLKRADLL